jgi:excisionase family DNA binding protein
VKSTNELFTVSGAARLISALSTPPISAATVRQWVDDGKLPALVTDGGVRLIARRDLEAMAGARRRKVDADEVA